MQCVRYICPNTIICNQITAFVDNSAFFHQAVKRTLGQGGGRDHGHQDSCSNHCQMDSFESSKFHACKDWEL